MEATHVVLGRKLASAINPVHLASGIACIAFQGIQVHGSNIFVPLDVSFFQFSSRAEIEVAMETLNGP